MSMDARGKFGGALVFSGWKGRPTVRQLVTPSNPQTLGQQGQRNMVRVAGAGQRFANLSLQLGNGRLITDQAAIRLITPSGYAWNGTLVEAIIGAGSLNYTAAAAAYAALTALQKVDWNSAAALMVPVIPAVNQVGVGGVIGTPMVAGEVMFHYQYGLYVLAIAALPGAVPPVYA